MGRWKRRALWTLAVVGGIGVLIQLVPYGRRHDNPPTRREPPWDSPRTRELVRRSCYDCHSNEVRWPWYSNVAPMSWLVQRDVDRARHELNFSEWDARQAKRADDAAGEVASGRMPLRAYVMAHSEARLTDAEKEELVRGLQASFGGDDEADGDGGRRRRGRGGD